MGYEEISQNIAKTDWEIVHGLRWS